MNQLPPKYLQSLIISSVVLVLILILLIYIIGIDLLFFWILLAVSIGFSHQLYKSKYTEDGKIKILYSLIFSGIIGICATITQLIFTVIINIEYKFLEPDQYPNFIALIIIPNLIISILAGWILNKI